MGTKLEDLLECNVIVYHTQSNIADPEQEKLYDMGIVLPESSEEDTPKEKIVKYYFDCSQIHEIRETKITYQDEWVDAIVVTFSSKFIVTPALLCSVEEFKRMLDEHNKKNS